MAVRGTIGSDQVNLENAATEDTLDKIFKILASTISPEKLNDILGKSGFDKKTVTEFVQEVGLASKIAGGLGGALGALDNAADGFRANLEKVSSTVSLFTNIAGSTSGVFGKLAEQSGIVGAFGRSLQLVSDFNESQLAVYQQLSTAGINFGGSLGDLRTSAAAMELSMDQFVGLMKTNSESLAKMGGNANEGAQNFKRLSQAMFTGDAGNKLKALGYTSEQVNQSMINYIAASGGRTNKEMEDVGRLTKSSENYMQNLDALARITGKSREQQEEAMKEAAANAAFESYMLTLSEDEREKAMAGMNAAMAYGGEGAKQAFMAQAQGFPPLVKSAQQFMATAGNMAEVQKRQIDGIKDSTVTIEEHSRMGSEYISAAREDAKMFEGAMQVQIMANGEYKDTFSQTLKTSTMANRMGVKNAEDARDMHAKIMKEQEENQNSSAATQVGIQDRMRQMGETLLNALVPLAEKVQPVIEKLAKVLSEVVTALSKIPYMGEAIVGVTALFFALKAAAGAKAGWQAISGVLDGGGGGGGGKGMPGAGKVGDDIGKLTKGAGPGAGGVLQSLAGGLKAFGAGAGQILIGAGVLAGAIAILSAGIGAAAFILGNTLPFLAEGLKSFAEIDGANLTMVGLGVGALAIGIGSLALAQAGKGTVDFLGGIAQAFGAKGLSTQLQEFADLGPGLKEAGEGLKTFTNALLGLTTINTDKLNVLASTMSNLNKSLPKKSFLDMAGEALVNLTQPLVQSSQAATPQIAGTNNINLNELVGVNTQMLAVMKDVVKQQKDTISAIKKLNKANF